jgi:DNA repair exonuclease SbcCD ATPase subunit
MITFKYIRWKNFLSTGNTWTEVNLLKNKSTLIVGENGAGKSTILDALSYALYAKPFRKINKNQLINSINSKGAEVEVEFSISTNNYKIIRGIKKYGSPKFEVYKNDELINQDASARDYQDVVEKNILKLNHKSFSQIVVLGSSTFVPFMQLSSQHRREVIEDLLDIQIFSTMNTLLKEKVATNKNKLMDVDYAINLAEEKISMQENYISQLKQNNEKRINDGKIKIAKADTQKKNHTDQIVTLQEEVERLQSEKADIDKVKTKKKKLEQFEYKMQDKISKLSQEIDFYGNHDDCPTCKQNIEEDFKCDIMDKKQKVLDETNTGFNLLKEEYAKIEERLQAIQNTIEQINNIQTEISSHNSQINALNQLIESIKEDIETSNVPKQSDTEKVKLGELNDELDNYHQEKESLTNDKGVLDVASLILKDSGIKTRIIKQYVPIMNKLVNKYLASMDFFVQFELDENFNETIKSRYRDEFSYASFSEGEKMRIDLALLFTWRAIAKLRNSASTNLLIMDEVFDSSLDTTGTEEFLKILNDLTSDANIFIISHKGDQLMDKFHNTIRFEKVKNFSRIAA